MGGNVYNTYNKLGSELGNFFPNLLEEFRKFKDCNLLGKKIKEVESKLDSFLDLEEFSIEDRRKLEKILQKTSKTLGQGVKWYLLGTQKTKISGEGIITYGGVISEDEYKKIINSQKGKTGGIEAMHLALGHDLSNLKKDRPTDKKKVYTLEQPRINWDELSKVTFELFEEFKWKPNCYKLIAEKLVELFPKYDEIINNRKVNYFFRRNGVKRDSSVFLRSYGWKEVEDFSNGMSRIEYLDDLSQTPYFQRRGGIDKLAKLGSHLFFQGQKEINVKSLYVALRRFRDVRQLEEKKGIYS